MIGYSAHETTLAALMIAMNIWEDIPPTYASALIFERYENGRIGIFYRNGTNDNDLYDFTQAICNQTECDAIQLRQSLKDVIPLNWNSECQNSSKMCKNSSIPVILLILSWIILIPCLLSNCSCYCFDQFRFQIRQNILYFRLGTGIRPLSNTQCVC